MALRVERAVAGEVRDVEFGVDVEGLFGGVGGVDGGIVGWVAASGAGAGAGERVVGEGEFSRERARVEEGRGRGDGREGDGGFAGVGCAGVAWGPVD